MNNYEYQKDSYYCNLNYQLDWINSEIVLIVKQANYLNVYDYFLILYYFKMVILNYFHFHFILKYLIY